ncbi:MAG: NAD(P)H-hydrate dehydratase [Candidatus Omnitrophica bacterium]|nr:NAD(P)H-hydrate dehydratase [Candidatus Omnitrophota bacterium]
MKIPLPKKFPLLPRKKDADKSSFGHVLVLAGSRGMTGAAVLTARAALVSGGGLVTLGAPRGLEVFMARAPLEVMPLGLPETKEGTLSGTAYRFILDFVKRRRVNALAVGPGLSQHEETGALVRRVVQSVSTPMVLDADGLNSFKGCASLFRRHRGEVVLTPHKREFERFFSEPWPEELSARIALAKKLSGFYHGTLVLKGSPTVVVNGEDFYVNSTGNPGMAKGGAGDALTGITASFIAQGLSSFQAALWAVYLHGKAADMAVKETSELGLTASDIVEYLPKVFCRYS